MVVVVVVIYITPAAVDASTAITTSQDNVIGDATFPICHNDNYEQFNRIKYYNFAKYLAFFMFQQQI